MFTNAVHIFVYQMSFLHPAADPTDCSNSPKGKKSPPPFYLFSFLLQILVFGGHFPKKYLCGVEHNFPFTPDPLNTPLPPLIIDNQKN